ncbi:endonuclease/Exonuclease/phosphatase family protein [Formosa agariphila KMM 3901]|uniref:Endonuclease/Exonuclease/phosphatase family protein n=1 Tax=Formosa agariphila (strain DSM 15362 / KCTC 12365 / LMG 23005 / KMM 3901 / M-2Alg 35-1) TaxID=1347342 RepID=T2KS82_FORAG|nr:endonuclease [Formosa agariphila]CDF81009.1 endonuclease/Exonuclease/phosphatase family protein [Formosa agariphila KMM 3901]
MNALKSVLYIICFVHVTLLWGQEREFSIHTIAFYNLENLFDIEDDPITFDESSPIMELANHREDIYIEKIKSMSRVISEIGFEVTQNAPTILGVSEIENRGVLESIINDSLLVKYNYGIVHFDSPDRRGIDVGLIYQKKMFTPLSVFNYPLHLKDELKGTPIYTRDQLVVSGLLEGDLIYIIVNHWPSRRGGETKSNPKRIAAAKLNKHIIDSLHTLDPYAKIISMGDFNDNPTNESFKSILKTEKEKRKVGLKGIYNPMEQLYNDGLGTTAYRDKWSLFDQVLVSGALLTSDFRSYAFYKAGVFNAQFLITKTGQYKGYPFRSFGYEGYTGGFSDHFPVYLYLIREKFRPKKSD